MKCRNETPLPFFSALLHLSVYMTLSAPDSHLNGRGAIKVPHSLPGTWLWVGGESLFPFTKCSGDIPGGYLLLEGTHSTLPACRSADTVKERSIFPSASPAKLLRRACLLALGWILQSQHDDTKSIPCAIAWLAGRYSTKKSYLKPEILMIKY